MDGQEEIESHPGCDALEQEWDRLARRVGAWPFLRPGWIAAWWRAFGGGEPRVLGLRREGRLVGVLPIGVRRARVRSPTNWHTPVYGPVADDADAARALLGSVLAEGPRTVELSFLDREWPGLAELRGLVRGYRLSERVVMRSPYVAIEGNWEAYFASLSRNHRGAVRRTRRRLEELGAVEVEVSEGDRHLSDRLEEAFAIEASGWKGERGTAIASAESTRSFYREVASWAARAGLLRLAFLRLDGRGIAVHIALEDARSHYLLKPGFDPEFGSFGPGRMLIGEMIRRSFELGHSSYEFLGHAAPYKLRWTEACHDRVHAQLFAPSLSGRFDRLLHTRAMPAARRVRTRLGG